MKKLLREKRKLELYLEKLEIDMCNKMDEIKETYKIDEEYQNKINEAHKIADIMIKTKFEISLLKNITKKERTKNE